MAGGRSGGAARRDQDVGSFDRRAGSYERDWRSEFHTRVVATAAGVALAALPDPVAVLDVGCGTGALLRTLADRLPAGVALAGVDPAPAMLEVGRAGLGRRSRVWLARAIAERLPFQDASFDLVVTTVSFAHWADQPAGLTEIARVLRPAGRLVLIDLFAIGWLRPLTALGRRRDRIHTPPSWRTCSAERGWSHSPGSTSTTSAPSPWPAPSSPAAAFKLAIPPSRTGTAARAGQAS
jgi:ubiquinone/menaquinone biosynthesis C-methylase UbiE